MKIKDYKKSQTKAHAIEEKERVNYCPT